MCGSQTLVKRKSDLTTVFPLRCRSWGCSKCAPRRRAALIRQGIDGHPNRFITLTVTPRWGENPEHRGQHLAKAWRDIVREYRRLWPGREAQYMVVLELTKRGEPHLHILWRGGFVPQKWLSGQMRDRMGAPQVDVRMIREQGEVTRYVAKYISKRNIKLGTMKRYWRSSQYLEETEKARKTRLNAGVIYIVLDLNIKKYRARFNQWIGGVLDQQDDGFIVAYSRHCTGPPAASARDIFLAKRH